MRPTLDAWLEQETESLKRQNLFRTIPLRAQMPSLHFCSNDYLGLSQHPRLKKASIAATEEFGTGSGGSRLVSGTFPIHEQLEKDVAVWVGKESALLLNSGYQAGVGVIPAVTQQGVIFSDEFNHASLIDGCRLSRAETFVYRHGDLDHLESLLAKHQDRFPRWIVTESIFGMEGEKAPLERLIQLKKKYHVSLFLDEAHALGVYGKTGCGFAEELNILPEIDLLMGTFSKACGSFGAFVTGSKNLITFLTNKSRSFMFTTALPPSVAAVNREAIALIANMEQERVALREKAKEVRAFFKNEGMETRGEDSPIIPLILGSAEKTLAFSKRFLDEGIWIQAIRPPTVPRKTSRLRITLSLSHQENDYAQLFRIFKKIHNENRNH